MRDKMVLNRTREDKSLDSTRATRVLGLSSAKPKRTTSANKSTFRTSTPVDPLLQLQPKVDIERMLLDSSAAGGSAGAASSRPQTRSQTRNVRAWTSHREVPADAEIFQTDKNLYFIDTNGEKVHT